MMAEDKLVEEKMAANQIDSKFINHLISLPVVDNTWAQLSTYYTMAKDYNAVMRFAFNTAESGAMKVFNTAQPVLNKYQPQITKADNFASDQLTKIEEKYPVIKKTPHELVTEGKEMYSHYVQPAVDKVYSVKEYSSSTLNSVKHMVSLESSKEYGKKQMQKATTYTQIQLKWLLQTDYGQQLLHQVEIYLTMSQDTMDKYLPPAENEEDEETEGPSEGASMERVEKLSKNITKRVYSKAIKDLSNVHAHTKEAVDKLLASLGLIETIHNNYDASKQAILNMHEKLVTTWSDITAEEDPSACKPDAEKTNHDLAISMIRRLTHQAKETVNKIYDTMPETPAVVKQLAEESYHYTESLYNSVKQAKDFQEVSSVLYSKTAESVLGLQQVLQTLIETPLSYVQTLPASKELEMDALITSVSEIEGDNSLVENGAEEMEESLEEKEIIEERKTRKESLEEKEERSEVKEDKSSPIPRKKKVSPKKKKNEG